MKGELKLMTFATTQMQLPWGISKNKEWKNKHLYLTISERLALPSSSPKGQESYPLFPLKYTLSQFPHQMGTFFNYWGFFAMIIMGTAKTNAKAVRCILSLHLSVKIQTVGKQSSEDAGSAIINWWQDLKGRSEK